MHIVWASDYLLIILNEILYEYDTSVNQHTPVNISTRPAISVFFFYETVIKVRHEDQKYIPVIIKGFWIYHVGYRS